MKEMAWPKWWEWILSGTATNDAPSADVRRDGNAQAEELVSSQGMFRQDDGTEAGSDSTEWPGAAEESYTALPEVKTPCDVGVPEQAAN